MKARNLTITKRPHRVGALIGFDNTTGATQYQADGIMGPSKGYQVFGLRDGITAVGWLTEARTLMRLDWRARKATA